jgi:hypothetical protein
MEENCKNHILNTCWDKEKISLFIKKDYILTISISHSGQNNVVMGTAWPKNYCAGEANSKMSGIKTTTRLREVDFQSHKTEKYGHESWWAWNKK